MCIGEGGTLSLDENVNNVISKNEKVKFRRNCSVVQ